MRTKIIPVVKILCILIAILITLNIFGISNANNESLFLDSSRYMIYEKSKQIARIVPGTTQEQLQSNLNKNITELDYPQTYGGSNPRTGATVKFEGIDDSYILSVIGDIDGNSIMDQIDLTLLIRHLVGHSIISETDIKSKSADANCDGEINQIDITTIIRYIVNGELNVPEIVKTDAPQIVKRGTEINGWYKTDVEIEIEENNLPEVESTVYRIIGTINRDEKEINNKETINLTENGEYTIISYSYNNDGTRSEVSTQTIKIDKDMPTLTVDLQEGEEQINVTAGASDGTSGIKRYIYYIGTKNGDDINYSAGVESQEGSYSFTNLTPGTEYGVKVEVEDNAGNKKIVEKTIRTKSPKITPTFTISSTSETVVIDETSTVTIEYNGDGELGATSSDTSIATVSVDQNAKTVTITGKKAGTAEITITATEGTEYSAGDDKTLSVTVTKKTPTFSISKTSGNVRNGETDVVTIEYNGNGTIEASSNNASVATVDVNASEKKVTITAEGEGTAEISIYANESDEYLATETKTYTITVTPAKTTPTLTFNETSDSMYDRETKVVTFNYDGDGALNVSSSNASVADVSVNASAKTITITGVGPGNAIITLSAEEGTTSLPAGPVTYTINVKAAIYEVSAGSPKYHTDLNAAIAACQSGGTINLLTDGNISTPGKFTNNVTFNTNGHTLYGSTNILTSNAGVTVLIKGGGTITSSSTASAGGDTIAPYGSDSVWNIKDGVNIKATGTRNGLAQNTGVSTVVMGGLIDGAYVYGGTLTLDSDGQINGRHDHGVQVGNGGRFDMENGTVSGPNTRNYE